jgi:DNA-directed RNA polymerase, mitochondrial
MHYNLIKQTNRRYLEELNNRWHEFPKVTQSINIMQKTEWVINKPIYDVLKKCIRNDYDLGKLPVNPETIELPPKPFDIATNEEAKIKWKREAQKVYKNRAKSKSKYIQINQILAEAEHFLNCGGFFYPYQFDFRGRIYPKPAMLSPQSADYSRALLKFKFGKKMGDDEAFADFAIAGSGLYGEVDKQELKVRTEWIEQYAKRIIECATNPFEYTWWTEADKPFCFLAWCYEYKAFADTDFDASFITTLPLQSDCSNSGLQHYSAMMLDEIGGKATNLVPSNKPADVYSLVANKVVMKLRDIPNSEYAKKWLEYGVDRKLCKKPVMCLPYSLTMYSCRQYLQDHLEKELMERQRQHPFGDKLFQATQWLTPIVWKSINEIIKGAKEIMGFLKDVSRLVASENLPVTWTSPLGLPIFMSCYKKESKRVKTMMGDSIIKLSLASETKLIDKRKTAQSICPNFIHSLDASVLQLAVVKANELGVDTFSLIHDSFGVVAPDVRLMAKALREAFCEIYSQDILANWAMEMKQMLSDKNKKKFKPIPAKGNLDLELVKQSLFFCI